MGFNDRRLDLAVGGDWVHAAARNAPALVYGVFPIATACSTCVSERQNARRRTRSRWYLAANAREVARLAEGGSKHGRCLAAVGPPTRFPDQHDAPADRWPDHGAGRGDATLVRADPGRERQLYERDLVGTRGHDLLAPLLCVGRIARWLRDRGRRRTKRRGR